MQKVRANLPSFPQSTLSLLLPLPLWVALIFTQSSRPKNLRDILTPLSSLPLCPLGHITRSSGLHFLKCLSNQSPPPTSVSTCLASAGTLCMLSNLIYYNSSSTTMPNFNSFRVDIFCLGLFLLLNFYFLFFLSNINYLFFCYQPPNLAEWI